MSGFVSIKLGDRVEDTITGFRGVVVARTEWLNGSVRVTVQAEKLWNGRPIEEVTFEEKSLVSLLAPYSRDVNRVNSESE